MPDALTEAERRQLAACLQREMETLQAQHAGGEAAAAPVTLDQQKVGRVSRVDALQQQAMALAGRQQAEQRLRRLREAVARLASSGYGFCEACGEPIGYARLSIRPEARHCVACQSRRER